MKRAFSDDADEHPSSQDAPSASTPIYRLEFTPASNPLPKAKRKASAKKRSDADEKTDRLQTDFSWDAIEKDIVREQHEQALPEHDIPKISQPRSQVTKERRQEQYVEKLKTQALAHAYKHAGMISNSRVASATIALVENGLFSQLDRSCHAVMSQHIMHVRHSSENLLPNSVEWLQVVKTFSVASAADAESETAELREETEEVQLDDILVELPMDDFASACYAHFRLLYCLPDNGMQLLSALVRNWKGSMPDRRLIFYVSGLRKYLARVNNRSAVPLKQVMVDQAVNQAHTATNCPFYFVEDFVELAGLIGRLTKAIEKRPLKLAKSATYRRVIGFCGQAIEKSGAVKVDAATGTGARDLWLKQLTMFPSVHGNRNLAEKVAEQYLSPYNLRSKLHSWGSERETIREMQHLKIKHGADRMRSLGPMLSKQLFQFYTSDHPDQLLRCTL